MYELTHHFELIRRWAEARNLIDGSDSFRQMTKLVEEMGELAHGIAKNRPSEIMDGIGDMVVVLTILAAQNGVDIEQCIALAWDEIKDRKGRMVDGIFVKEADLVRADQWSPEQLEDMRNKEMKAALFAINLVEKPPLSPGFVAAVAHATEEDTRGGR